MPRRNRWLRRFTSDVITIWAAVAITLSAGASEMPFPRDVAAWSEDAVPPESARAERVIWMLAADRSHREWRVRVEGDRVYADLAPPVPAAPVERPDFVLSTDGMRGRSTFARVDDGWIVEFDKGEFGRSLTWYSTDGSKSYEIEHPRDRVRMFFTRDSVMYALAGYGHRSDRGSILRVSRGSRSSHWEVTQIADLPSAPVASAELADGTLLVAMSRALATVNNDWSIWVLTPRDPWVGSSPSSIAISPDQKRAYFGMRQYVAEFEFATRRIRFLYPSREYLNALSPEEETEIRRNLGGG